MLEVEPRLGEERPEAIRCTFMIKDDGEDEAGKKKAGCKPCLRRETSKESVGTLNRVIKFLNSNSFNTLNRALSLLLVLVC